MNPAMHHMEEFQPPCCEELPAPAANTQIVEGPSLSSVDDFKELHFECHGHMMHKDYTVAECTGSKITLTHIVSDPVAPPGTWSQEQPIERDEGTEEKQSMDGLLQG